MLEQCVPCPATGVYLATDGSCGSKNSGWGVCCLTFYSGCIQGCSKCSDSLTCDHCGTGYGLIDSVCVLCPVRTYVSDQSCKGIVERGF